MNLKVPEKRRVVMKHIEKAISLTERLGNLLGVISGWMVAIMMLLVGVEVFMRYIFNKPPLVADEFSAYLLVAISFFGISQAFLADSHVRITFVVDRISKTNARRVRLVTLILSEILIIVMCISSYHYLSFSFMINERSPSWVNFPLKYPQSTVLIGFSVFALVVLGQIAKALRKPANNMDAKN